MRDAFNKAIANIVTHGDTDIFPFPIENHIFYDKRDAIADLLESIEADFTKFLTNYPPSNYSTLVPLNYTGFRWATQIDPFWNAYFLGLVISIADSIEKARLPVQDKTVYSYRYEWNDSTKQLFNVDLNWRTFMERSLELAKQHPFVVSCDISEFYPRLNHHRLENALLQLSLKGNQPSRLMEFLKNFSGTYSFGIPVGGPSSRLLSELLLNQIDRLLKAESITFCRFADDYHIFCNSHEDCINNLLFLSERLVINQGLQLQKSKTRILSGHEFISTSPLALKEAAVTRVPATGHGASASEPGGEASTAHPRNLFENAIPLRQQTQNFLRFSIRFDPYSPTAGDDYETLKAEIKKYDIISLLRGELSKSRIHISLSKKIVTAIRFIDSEQRNNAVLSLISNSELLYPIYSNVLLVARPFLLS